MYRKPCASLGVAIVTAVTVLAIVCAARAEDFQTKWQQLIKAAQAEGQINTFLCCPLGREGEKTLIPRFEKKFGVKVLNSTGRSSQQRQKIGAERRAGKFTLDVWAGGPSLANINLVKKGVLRPLRPLLFHPEVVDESKWWGGKMAWFDAEEKYQIMMVGRGGRSYVGYNTKLLDPAELESYWDLLKPKWKGKMVMFDPRVGGGGGQNVFMYFNKQLGPKFIKKLLTEMKVFYLTDGRKIAELVANGAFAMAPFRGGREFVKLRKLGLPVEPELPKVLKEGVALSSGGAGLFAVRNPPHPNAQKLFINWLLSREGQYLLQEDMKTDSLRIDIDKNNVDPADLRRKGIKYFLAEQDPNFSTNRKKATGFIKKVMKEAGL